MPCSQCGQTGHNRRNRMCPGNQPHLSIPQAPRPEIIDQRNILCQTYFATACNELALLRRSINERVPNHATAGQFILNSFRFVENFCTYYTRALHYDDFQLPLISANYEHFRLLEEEVIRVNNILQTEVMATPLRVYVYLTEGRCAYMRLLIPEHEPKHKPTLTYLKELSLVHDLTVSSEDNNYECPICYDEVNPLSVVYTNCKHGYCGTCVKHLSFHMKGKSGIPACSLCKQEITSLAFGNTELYNEIHNHIHAL